MWSSIWSNAMQAYIFNAALSSTLPISILRRASISLMHVNWSTKDSFSPYITAWVMAKDSHQQMTIATIYSSSSFSQHIVWLQNPRSFNCYWSWSPNVPSFLWPRLNSFSYASTIFLFHQNNSKTLRRHQRHHSIWTSYHSQVHNLNSIQMTSLTLLTMDHLLMHSGNVSSGMAVTNTNHLDFPPIVTDIIAFDYPFLFFLFFTHPVQYQMLTHSLPTVFRITIHAPIVECSWCLLAVEGEVHFYLFINSCYKYMLAYSDQCRRLLEYQA